MYPYQYFPEKCKTNMKMFVLYNSYCMYLVAGVYFITQ